MDIYIPNASLMSFMSCFRKSVFSRKHSISFIIRSSYQAWTNHNVNNEKPVYNPIITFSSQCPQDTHNNLLSSALVLYPLQTVPTSKGPEAWDQKLAHVMCAGLYVCEHMWLLRLRLWNTFVQSSETCSADPSSPLWVNVPCPESWPFTLPTPLATDHELTGFILAPPRPAWLFLTFSITNIRCWN